MCIGLRACSPNNEAMENQTEKILDNEMDTGAMKPFIGDNYTFLLQL